MATAETTFETPSAAALVENIEGEIAASKERLRLISEAERVERAHLERLEDSRKSLRREVRKVRARRPKTAVQRAGQGNLDKVARLLQKGPRTKAAIVEKLGVNNGTITYALKALEEQGQVRATGKSERGSREWEIVRSVRVARPGS